MSEKQILDRLDRLEREVVGLRNRLALPRAEAHGKTWRDYIGMFGGDPDFQKAVAYGAKYRRSLRPKMNGKTRKK